MFEKKMETEAIPERLLSLCQMLVNGSVQEDEIRKTVEPSSLNDGKTTYFKKVCDAAIQLGLVGRNDDTKDLELLVDADIVSSHESLKHYIVRNLDKLSLGQFYKTTQIYISKSKELFSVDKDFQNVSKLVDILNEMYKEDSENHDELGLVNENMLAWRFWATYLGFGYLHGMFFMPNVAAFLKTCIECSNIESGKLYTMSEFVDLLHPFIDICINSNDENSRTINMALSNGFRSLHDLGIIELKYENDRQDEWNLSTMELHAFSSLVTDCIYKEKR